MDRRFMAFWHKKLKRENWDYFFCPEERSESVTNNSGGLALALFIIFTGIALMSTGKKK